MMEIPLGRHQRPACVKVVTFIFTIEIETIVFPSVRKDVEVSSKGSVGSCGFIFTGTGGGSIEELCHSGTFIRSTVISDLSPLFLLLFSASPVTLRPLLLRVTGGFLLA